VAMVSTHFFVPESPIKTPGSINWAGAVLLSAWLTALLLGVSEGSGWGWGSARVLGLFAAAVVCAALWVRNERRAREPLVDMRMMPAAAVDGQPHRGPPGRRDVLLVRAHPAVRRGAGLDGLRVRLASVTGAGLFLLPLDRRDAAGQPARRPA